MSSIEYELFTKWQREMILKNCLAGIRESCEYDYILIDAPPTLGGWVINILCASDGVILPVEASPWGLFGVANMFEFLEDVKKIAPRACIAGCGDHKAGCQKKLWQADLRGPEGL